MSYLYLKNISFCPVYSNIELYRNIPLSSLLLFFVYRNIFRSKVDACWNIFDAAFDQIMNEQQFSFISLFFHVSTALNNGQTGSSQDGRLLEVRSIKVAKVESASPQKQPIPSSHPLAPPWCFMEGWEQGCQGQETVQLPYGTRFQLERKERSLILNQIWVFSQSWLLNFWIKTAEFSWIDFFLPRI